MGWRARARGEDESFRERTQSDDQVCLIKGLESRLVDVIVLEALPVLPEAGPG